MQHHDLHGINSLITSLATILRTLRAVEIAGSKYTLPKGTIFALLLVFFRHVERMSHGQSTSSTHPEGPARRAFNNPETNVRNEISLTWPFLLPAPGRMPKKKIADGHLN